MKSVNRLRADSRSSRQQGSQASPRLGGTGFPVSCLLVSLSKLQMSVAFTYKAKHLRNVWYLEYVVCMCDLFFSVLLHWGWKSLAILSGGISIDLWTP